VNEPIASTDKPTAVVKFHAVRLPDGGILGLGCYGGPFGPGHFYDKDGRNSPTAAEYAPDHVVSHAAAERFFHKLPKPLTGPAAQWLADLDAAVAAANGRSPQPVTTAPPQTGKPIADVKFDVVRFNGSIGSLYCFGGPFGTGHVYEGGGNCQTSAPHDPDLAVSPDEAEAFLRKLRLAPDPASAWLADLDAARAAASGHAPQPVTTAPPAQADARLSRRDEFARAAMTGILASPTEDGAATIPRFMAEAAVACADALIAELDKTPPAPRPAKSDAALLAAAPDLLAACKGVLLHTMNSGDERWCWCVAATSFTTASCSCGAAAAVAAIRDAIAKAEGGAA